jgi:tetratricopeptide (TPR) repeat protein
MPAVVRRGLAALALAAVAACAPDSPSSRDSSRDGARLPEVAPPAVDTSDMEPEVAARLDEARRGVLEHPESAASWGRFGMVAHAHELWDEARIAYRRARELDPADARWPYFLGDVLSVPGTDLEAATAAFERALELRPGYAPAHMRLGRVLVGRGQLERAAAEFERAVALAPDLHPAQLGLAQVRISQGRMAEAEELLDAILAAAPRHEQALAALGQVYMRQGRRAEARAVALRARDAAIYNLFSDPLMDEVVREQASTVLLWERAKAFFDAGNYEQAALGLELVVQRRPADPDVHHQLGVAYGHLNRLDRARHHLERVVALDGARPGPHLQLAMLHLEQERPAEAIPSLERLLELDPAHPDAGWLLARARIASGDPQAGLAAFEAAARAARRAGRETPAWAHNDWASALAQAGRPDEALDHLRAALAADPRDAQALFYSGLVYEGLGRIEEAVESYCRSQSAQADSPAGGRLRALNRSCGMG